MQVHSITNSGTFSVLDLSNDLDGTGITGIIAVKKGDTNVTVQGSLDNTTFLNMETFTTSTVKEFTIPPYLRINGDTTDSAATVGSSTVKLMTKSRAKTKSGR